VATLKGIVPALITPVTHDEKINEKALRKLANRLIDAGVHGLFALGTTGEFFSLSQKEKLTAISTVIDEAAGKVPVVIGTGAVSTRESIELSKKAEEMGADYLSVITPYFNCLSQRELSEHYLRIASAVSIPIILYNIPARTGLSLSDDTVSELARVPNIVGIKDSSGKFDNILSYIEVSKGLNFSVYAGTDSLILKTLMAGGSGAVAATACVFPELVVSIYEFWKRGDMEKAEKAQEMLFAIRDFSAKFSIPAAYKAALEIQGIDAGPPISPALQLPYEEKEKLKNLLKKYEKEISELLS